MKKICFVIDLIESPTAGTEKQLLLLIKMLDRAKFEPYLCVLRSTEWLNNHFNMCRSHEIGMYSFGTLAGWLAIIKFALFLKNEKIDIVQTHFRDGGIVGVIAGKIAGIKTIIGSRRNQGFWLNRQELLILKILNKWTNIFIANCEDTKHWAAKTEKIEPDRIKVIYNGLETENFYRATEEQRLSFRKTLSFPSDAIIIGIVANLRPVKAIDVFIKAAKIVSEKSTRARFIIIGDGPERKSLEKLRNDFDIASLVKFLGKRVDIPNILSCIDIGVLSSESESFSNSIVEYMAAGLAVVCTGVGGAKEAIEDGVNGFVVEPNDPNMIAEKLQVLINTQDLNNIGKLGREKACRMFSCLETYNKLQIIYEGMG